MNHIIILLFLSLSVYTSIQAQAEAHIDYLPQYKKWRPNYEIRKIEYTSESMIIHFKFTTYNQTGASAIFYPPESLNAWLLRDKKRNTTYPLRTIRNIRLNNYLLTAEISGKQEFFIDDSKKINEFSCEIVFDRLPPNVDKVDLLEGLYQRSNKNHFHCLNIKIIPTLGKSSD